MIGASAAAATAGAAAPAGDSGYAAAAGAAAVRGESGAANAGLRESVNGAAEREAIRRLHLTLLAHVEQRDFAGAAAMFAAADGWRASGLGDDSAAQSACGQDSAHSGSRRIVAHTAYRQTSAQRLDEIALSEDGAQATARFHVEAEVCTPIQGDCTAAQMARLQGNVASRHWESGRFEMKLAKTQGNWKIVSLAYERAPSTES